MAKKSSKTEPEFFEAIPAAPVATGPAIDVDKLSRSAQDAVSSARQRLAPWLQQLAIVARAAASDMGHFGLAIGRGITSPTARRAYIITFLIGTVAVTGTIAFVATSTTALYAEDLSNPSTLMNKKNTGTTILDRNGVILYQGFGANTRQPVKIAEVPKYLVNASLAAEDPNFYNHAGISWRGTARALFRDITHHGTVEGGSTITQQLVKNTLLDPTDKSIVRKAREAVLAIELERRYSKDQIMEMYLNDIYYGQGSYGIGSASQTYFNKPAKDLTIGQSALLAGLVLAPSRWDPTIDPQAALGRRNFIIERMETLGYISPEQAAAAKAEAIQAAPRQIEIKAPHFVFYVLDQLRQQYGDDQVEHGGITVYSSLDLTKQAIAETEVKAQIIRLQSHHASNGGLISLDPATGEIISMVGSIDYNEPNFGNVNVTLSQLQPGSSIKPIVYLEAFTKGWNGASTVDDEPISLPSGDGTIYKPVNYDGKFRGKHIRLRRALGNSLNIPAIHVLQFAGIHDSIDLAHKLGITTLNDESRYGLSLVLGGGEVRPIDMATAFGVMANQGNKVTPRAIMKVLDRNNHDITKVKNPPAPTPVVDPRLTYMMSDILSDNNARLEEFGPNSALKLSHVAAVKTGTTNDFRDNWTVGYSPGGPVTAVWVGNNDHSPMSNVDGVTGAAPIWHNYMEAVLTNIPNKPFTRPDGIVTVKVCSADGGLANPWDQGIDENFLAEAKPTKHCGTSAPKPPQTPTPVPSSTVDPNLGGGTLPATPIPTPVAPEPPQPPKFPKGQQ